MPSYLQSDVRLLFLIRRIRRWYSILLYLRSKSEVKEHFSTKKDCKNGSNAKVSKPHDAPSPQTQSVRSLYYKSRFCIVWVNGDVSYLKAMSHTWNHKQKIHAEAYRKLAIFLSLPVAWENPSFYKYTLKSYNSRLRRAQIETALSACEVFLLCLIVQDQQCLWTYPVPTVFKCAVYNNSWFLGNHESQLVLVFLLPVCKLS